MSAGGASVHYHMLSPMSSGLFKQAISLSGSALNWWANIPGGQRKYGLRVADLHGCGDRGSAEEMVNCLREVPFQQLADSHQVGRTLFEISRHFYLMLMSNIFGKKFFDWHPLSAEREPMNVFSPRSDPEAAVPFLPEEPLETMRKGKINKAPYITGSTEVLISKVVLALTKLSCVFRLCPQGRKLACQPNPA